MIWLTSNICGYINEDATWNIKNQQHDYLRVSSNGVLQKGDSEV